MEVIDFAEIQRRLDYAAIIQLMRAALIAQSRGQCDTPMPMHLDILPEQGEVHMKSSYRADGDYFALKTATSFPNNLSRGLPVGSGMMLLSSAETGQPVAMLEDRGHLTDVRTAAVSALVSQAIGRTDSSLGILGTGIQARLQAQLHAQILDLKVVYVWGRTPDRVDACCDDIQRSLEGVRVESVSSPGELAEKTKLIVTVTAARTPLLASCDVRPGMHVSAVGADSIGKQELDAQILRRSDVLLVDSHVQCARLGELQHALDQQERALEIGQFLESGESADRDAISVCDFTGLGVEDLYIAEYCYSSN